MARIVTNRPESDKKDLCLLNSLDIRLWERLNSSPSLFAGIAQLVERLLAMQKVARSNRVARSIFTLFTF